MKKIFICLLAITTITQAHKSDNPYYAFIKKNSDSFVHHLKDHEIVDCLHFLSGDYTVEKGEWFKHLTICCEDMCTQFLEVYNACITKNTIKNIDQQARQDEFGVYLMTALYRIVYNYAQKNNIEFDIKDSMNTKTMTKTSLSLLMHPDEFDAACLLHIHDPLR